MRSFRVTLCCPVPRNGWGTGPLHIDNELEEMKCFLSESGDIIVYPEGFLKTELIPEACALAKRFGKWVILGTDGPAADRALEMVVISSDGEIAGRHVKTTLTASDIEGGIRRGDRFNVIDTPFGAIGPVLCYEIHFPEISRIFALGGAQLLVNSIGTGMWNEQQFDEWTTVARARAIENRAFVLGCTHFCDEIPMAYAFGPDGNTLGLLRNTHGCMTVSVDLSKITERDYLQHRTAALYGALSDAQDYEFI